MKMKKFDSINVIPFIDIMLVLLVIVLTTATFVARGVIPLDLASSISAQKEDNDQKELRISIDKTGAIYFEKEKVNKEDLLKKLDGYKTNQNIKIACDKDMKYENFIFLLDNLKLKKFTNLNILTNK